MLAHQVLQSISTAPLAPDDEAASYSDGRVFKAFDVAFIALFVLVVLGVVLLG
jgi:hypothetical protein